MGAITDFFDSALGFVSDTASSIADTIGDAIITAISNFVGMLLYYVTKALMSVVALLQELFNVFSGTTKVQYNDEYDFLLNVFFQNRSVKNIYWAMALLGITFVIVFTMVSVIRKTFDLSDKHQNQSMGTILTAMFKSIFTMLILSAALLASLTLTNLVINRIGYIFDNADSFSQKKEIHFTDEQYATMARIYKTIGNYSLNPSYTSRYNLNSCYNDIRQDLNYLEQQKVFDMVYISEKDGETIDTWQSVLQELVYATDSSRELRMDVYYEEVSNSLLKIMKILQTNAEFYPISDYESGYTVTNSVGLDRILFLSGTTSAAKNEKYNENPYLTDGLRGAFYTGEKSIYNFDHVKAAFDIGLTGINYIFIWILTYFTLKNLLRCIFGCVMRIFNMVSLYIVAPLAVSTMPLDEGEKFKQWTMAMVIQAFGILGMIIPMRLIILFAPIILSPKLVLFESVSLNFVAKVLLIVGGLEAVEGFGQMVTGILANNTSYAALNAGNRAGQLGDQAFEMGKAATKATAKGAMKLGFGAAKLGGKVALGAGAAAVGAAGVAASGIAAGAYHGAKGIGAGISALRNYLSDRSAQSGGSSGASGHSSGTDQSGGKMIEMADLSGKSGSTGGAPSNLRGIGSSGQPTGGMKPNGPTSGRGGSVGGGAGLNNLPTGKSGSTGGTPNNLRGIGSSGQPTGGVKPNAPISGKGVPSGGGKMIEMADLSGKSSSTGGAQPTGGSVSSPLENKSNSYSPDNSSNAVPDNGGVNNPSSGSGSTGAPMDNLSNSYGADDFNGAPTNIGLDDSFYGGGQSGAPMDNLSNSYGGNNMVSEYGSVDDFLSDKQPTVRPMENIGGSYGSNNIPGGSPVSGLGNSQSSVTNPAPAGNPVQANSPASVGSPVQVNNPVQVSNPVQTNNPVQTSNPVQTGNPVQVQSVPKKQPPPRKRSGDAQYVTKIKPGEDPLSQMKNKRK